MKCSCPKCHAEIELNVADVTEAGTPADCPLCQAKLVVHRESFGARVYRKAGEISCGNCGEILGPQTYCASCGTNFPDYFVVSPGRKPLSKVKKVKLRSSPFSKQISFGWTLPKLQPTAPRDSKPSGARPAAKKGPAASKPMVLILAGILVLVLAGGGYFYYSSRKAAAEYTQNFINTAYCMQTAADRGLKSCAKLAADAKTKMDAGQTAPTRLAVDEERDLKTLKSQIEALMQKMKEPPEKYVPANDKLGRLYSSYLKVNNLALNPPAVPSILADSATKVEGDYQRVVKDFKSGLPEDLVNELRQASKRHQSLKPLVD
ncbi:flagellar basal body-associated FliL family protein [Geomesophilobacter sediminis]|uniref:Uncharacterized protein n=1 Tax=Geomesophilobacter sediminis TaxID=2798584 RepID=A0A8J7JBI9_9BACT|nr:hypothetical protein [Geomesophilobacter sediminis]MBJ6723953.1 hypothetical protein [Geomesophilobacter sediminis]